MSALFSKHVPIKGDLLHAVPVKVMNAAERHLCRRVISAANSSTVSRQFKFYCALNSFSQP